MTTLNGNNSAKVQNAPKPEKPFLGIRSEVVMPKYAHRTYRLSIDCARLIENLSTRFSNEMGFKISMNKVIETAVGLIQYRKLRDIMDENDRRKGILEDGIDSDR